MRFRFVVYDNGKPARYPEFNVHPLWSKCVFNSFDEALIYVCHWLGAVSSASLPDNWNGSPICYLRWYGDTIEIRKEER